jgi:hypothetical protein
VRPITPDQRSGQESPATLGWSLTEPPHRGSPGWVPDSEIDTQTQGERSQSKRRFTLAALIGISATAIPYFWILCSLWTGSLNLLRTARSNGDGSNFYDLQARSMFHGHLYVAKGVLGGEAFVHAGHQYTYFGLFPSLLRMPVLLVTSRLDGRLTAPSMLLAWLVTALFASVLVWRVRSLVRGSAVLGRAEAASYGALLATVMGGSILMTLASNPWVFSEDLAWSVALTVGSLFALVGVLERPTWGRIVGCGLLILAAVLTRGPTGYACVIGAVLVAIWLGLGRTGHENRQWAVPMLVAGLVPLLVSCLVDYAKFGILFGLSASDQLAYQVFGLNQVGNGSYFGLHYLPSTVSAYFRPTGLRLSTVFPFITPPSAQARPVGGVHLFGSDRVASISAAMPLLFLLSVWGVISVFKPRPLQSSPALRIVLVTAAAGGAVVLVYGWIASRFIGDFLPFLVLASAIGLVDVWRRLERRSPKARFRTMVVVMALAAYCIVANVAIANTPFSPTWSRQQYLHFVETQNSISRITGDPLSEVVMRGSALPTHAVANQLFIAGNCSGLYVASGISDGLIAPPKMIPIEVALYLGLSWFPLELAPPIIHTLDLTFRAPPPNRGLTIPLVVVGKGNPSTVSLQFRQPGKIRFILKSPQGTAVGSATPVAASHTYRFTIVTDEYRHSASVTSSVGTLLSGFMFSRGPVVEVGTAPGSGRSDSAVRVTDVTPSVPSDSICRSLP